MPVAKDAVKAEKVPAPRETTPSWSLDDWDYSTSEDNQDLTLNRYKKNDQVDTIYIPNAADLKEKDSSTEITQVHINRGAIDSIRNKASNVVVSNKDGQKVKFDDNNPGQGLSSAFAGVNNLKSVDLRGLDVSGVVNMGNMFSHSSNLESVDLSGWDTSSVQFMDNMFNGDSQLKTLSDASSWDISNVKNMSSMFDGCSNLTIDKGFNFNSDSLKSYISNHRNDEIIDVSGLNTSHVDNMSNLFQDFKNLITVSGLDKWDTSNVTNMGHMFAGDPNLTEVDMTGWDTSKVQYMDNMFYDNFNNVFDGSLISVGDLSGWDLSSVQTMENMFRGTTKLASVDFSRKSEESRTTQNTEHLTNMNYMFEGSGVTSVNLSGLDLSHLGFDWFIHHRGSEGMFANLKNPCTITMDNIKLPSERREGFDINDFTGDKPLIVFSDNPDLAKLNTKHWNNNGQDVIGRQNSNYLTYYKKGDANKTPIAYQKMNFVFSSKGESSPALILAEIPAGDATAGNSDIFAKYLEQVTSVEKVKDALDDLGSKWNFKAPIEYGKNDTLNANIQDGHLPYDIALSPLDLIVGKYGLTFTAKANVHYIFDNGTEQKEITHQETDEYDTTTTTSDDLFNTWDWQHHGWQLDRSHTPADVPATDGDYYVYLTAPDLHKKVTVNINYETDDGRSVDPTVPGNPAARSKVLNFKKKAIDVGSDLYPVYEREWNTTDSLDSITTPATVKDRNGHIYDINIAGQHGDSALRLDNNRNIHLTLDPNSSADAATFTLTIPYVRRSEPVDPADPGNPDDPYIPDPTDPDKPDQPDTPDNPNQPDQPNKPDQPDKPNKPDTPDKPAKPDKPGEKHQNGKKNTPVTPRQGGVQATVQSAKHARGAFAKNTQQSLPQTGSNDQLGWLGLSVASLAALLGLAGNRKKNKN